MNNKQNILELVKEYGVARLAETLGKLSNECPDTNGFNETLTNETCTKTDDCENCWKVLIKDAMKEVK